MDNGHLTVRAYWSVRRSLLGADSPGRCCRLPPGPALL